MRRTPFPATSNAESGYYINDSIQLLFSLIYNGLSGLKQQKMMFEKGIGRKLFEIPPLKTHLFDPERTPILNKVKFRNTILQRVIELMSLSRQGGRNSRRGRISYAQLGINQLGAVYEALLSYQGFFAQTDLFEVKKSDDTYDELKNAYFVKAEDLEKYTDEEKVYNSDGSLKKYPKGKFIYRLAGRDREKSASYYTPEVLTKCLVKYALKELLKDKSADDTLKLTVCEPAMGSAAFLNEAINQLAEAYLDRKQKEKGERIAHDEYAYERQKVKMYLADNNVFGVDLNPVAVELAEVSLWLNTISKENFVPWFGMQLVCGNSLIGARRQVFKNTLLKKENRTDTLWLDESPERVMPKEKRSANTIYHFLLPDKGMANYKDKVIKQLAGDNIKKINNWRKIFIKEFSKSGIKALQKLSDTIDKLWTRHTEQQRDMRERTTDVFLAWGQESAESRDNTGTRWKDKVLEQELLSKQVRNSSPYRRLKLAMDYWCSLWFWPIDKADLLPSREQYLLELNLILEGNPIEVTHGSDDQLMLFSDTMPKQMQMKLVNELGFIDIDKLCAEVERLALVQKLAEKYRFLHWELEFADLFDDRGGFDLVLGNPPWIKVEWHEGGILSDTEPQFVVKKLTASNIAKLREETLHKYNLENEYIEEYIGQASTQKYLNAYVNYPMLNKAQSNLYKCFLPQAWMIGSSEGVFGFLHPEGVYDDPNGSILRAQLYPRIRFHLQFQNELKLFPEVHHETKFSINIYSSRNESISFVTISNLFAVSAIDMCFGSAGNKEVEGIKDINNKWNIMGHPDRVIYVNEDILSLFRTLYDSPEISISCARLPAIHSSQVINVLKKFAAYPKRLSNLSGEYFSTKMFDESGAQKDRIILRKTCFPEKLDCWVLSGPHYYVGNLFYKTPRVACQKNSDYDVIDLTVIPEEYMPRTNYVSAINDPLYNNKTPVIKWPNKKDRTLRLSTDYYRVVNREMIGSSAERTFVPTLIPKGIRHICTSVSTCFKDNINLLCFLSPSMSILIDFFVKSTGSGHASMAMINQLPLIEKDGYWTNELFVRTLGLIALTNHFSELWKECWRKDFTSDRWTKNDHRLPNAYFENLKAEWSWNSALRYDYMRYQAMMELDILIAFILSVSIEELKSIYKIQFPVLRQYESDTWYDQKGKIVFTCSKGLTSVGCSRPEWNEIKDMKEGTVERKIIDDTLPGGPKERTIVYHAPFDRCDREKDYEIAWKEFERRFKDKKANK